MGPFLSAPTWPMRSRGRSNAVGIGCFNTTRAISTATCGANRRTRRSWCARRVSSVGAAFDIAPPTPARPLHAWTRRYASSVYSATCTHTLRARWTGLPSRCSSRSSSAVAVPAGDSASGPSDSRREKASHTVFSLPLRYRRT